MRKIGVILVFVLVFCLGTVSASITVHNLSVKDSYAPSDILEGKINLTISDIRHDTMLTTGSGKEMLFGDFLSANGVVLSGVCTPSDCSSSYVTSASGGTTKSFPIRAGNYSYAGFVLNGDNIQISGVSFDIASDFARGQILPLKIKFFEDAVWNYNLFSEEYSQKNYGCYDAATGVPGPLIITSSYCEKIEIQETGSLRIGAKVDAADDKELKMVIYSDTGGASVADCLFNPSSEEDCVVEPEEDVFDEGEYYVCVESEEATGYHLYTENSSGDNCGFVYPNAANIVRDYGIFAKTAKYEDASVANISDFSSYLISAEDLLLSRYSNDCSNDCILPIRISGVPQSLEISNIMVTYVSDAGDDQENEIYPLSVSPAIIDYSGELDLELLDFELSSGDEDFTLYLGDVKIIDEKLSLFPAPIINSVYPTNPPAGVPITFYADIEFRSNASLTYNWDFGDGTKETTSSAEIVHTYNEIKNYTLKLSVSAGGNLTKTATFQIRSVNPQEAVNITIVEKRNSLNDAIKDINALPAWYQSAVETIVRTAYFDDELKRIETSRNSAYDQEDFLDIAKSLFALDVPASVFISDQSKFPLLTELEDIDPEPVKLIGGGGSGNASLDGYKNPILRWQTEFVDSMISMNKVSSISASGNQASVLVVYSVSVTSNDAGESYFVIGKDRGDLFFKEEAGVRKEGTSSVIILESEETKAFSFYYEGSEDAPLFVSPKLGMLVIDADIDMTCNSNNRCERDLGENADNCRNDCKPIWRMVIYLILAFIFVLILYTVLQVWYKTRYEKFLFQDRRLLFNLVMFITNARARGMNDDQIYKLLSKSGWSSERINYALRKSVGARTGMFEIIPIEKIFAGARNRGAKKKALAGTLPAPIPPRMVPMAGRKIATGNRQQTGRKINKDGSRR
jgi:PKD repeat protein